MSIDFILPDIGEGIVECELVEWLVAEGDVIAEDQHVADVMTDKALVQIPAMHSGVVDKLYYAQGEIAKVHQPLFSMTPEGSTETQSAVAPSLDETIAAEIPIAPAPTTASASGTQVEDFILPDIGEGIVEREIVKWCIQEVDMVEEDQVVVVVMTDKAVVEIPAKYQGKVVKLHYQQGDI